MRVCLCKVWWAPLCLLAACLSVPAHAQVRELTEMTLEELLNIEVTSVSRKPESRAAAAAAIHVITQEDIHRSGATTVPELLRMVPGVHVARLDASKWSVTIRGTSGRFANKLLVLLDGRSLYTSLYSGVEWELRDVILDDVERIEVIRGPGGTLWGANAVNGVINIVTKHAGETGGSLLDLRMGTEESNVVLRYGGLLSDSAAYRVYGEFTRFNHAQYQDGRSADDDWRRSRLGFRVDWDLDQDAFMFQGDLYTVKTNQLVETHRLRWPAKRLERTTEDYHGGHLLGRWTRDLEEGANLQVLLYGDYSVTDSHVLDDSRLTLGVQAQHRFRPHDRHELVWGLEYRVVRDHVPGGFNAELDPARRTFQLLSLFLQDEIALTDTLRLWLGAKLEYNEFTGVEFQPSVRVAYAPDDRQTLWAAVSRAVRTPSRVEADGRLTLTTYPRARVMLTGDDSFQAENLLAYELGYRLQATPRAALDLTAYYHDYQDLRTLELGRPRVSARPLPFHLVFPFGIHNNATAEVYGFEAAVDWKPLPQLRTRLAYTYSVVHARVRPKTYDPITVTLDGDTPEQQVYLQAMWDITRRWQLDTTLRYVDPLPALQVKAYFTADLRVAYRLRENLELSLVGRNLLQPAHREFDSSFIASVPTQVERSVYGQITSKFGKKR